MSTPDLLSVAQRLAAILGDQAVLIGGMAVSALGHVRATRDVDFASREAPEQIQQRFSRYGIAVEVHHGDLLEGDLRWVVRGLLDGIPFDVIAPPVELDWDQTTVVQLTADQSIRIVGLRDLFRLKMKAGGSQDIWDVAKLVRIYPEETEWVQAQAATFGVAQALDLWLQDPRL